MTIANSIIAHPLVWAFLLLVFPLSYLSFLSENARQAGELELAGLFSSVSNAFLFFAVASMIVLIISRLGWLGQQMDSLSANSGEQIFAGIGFGALAWPLLQGVTGGAKSLFFLPMQTLFSTAGQALAQPFWKLYIVAVAAPIGEEFFFGFALPALLFFVLGSVFKMLRIPFATALAVVAVVSVSFAYFHVFNQTDPSLLFVSVLFRVIILSVIYLDQINNIVPFLNVGIGTAWGIHLSNNILNMSTPIKFVETMLAGDGSPQSIIFGVFVLAFFALSFYHFARVFKINQLLRRVTG